MMSLLEPSIIVWSRDREVIHILEPVAMVLAGEGEDHRHGPRIHELAQPVFT